MAFNNRNNLSNESAPWGREVEQKIESNTYDLNQLRLLTENNNKATNGTLSALTRQQQTLAEQQTQLQVAQGELNNLLLSVLKIETESRTGSTSFNTGGSSGTPLPEMSFTVPEGFTKVSFFWVFTGSSGTSTGKFASVDWGPYINDIPLYGRSFSGPTQVLAGNGSGTEEVTGGDVFTIRTYGYLVPGSGTPVTIGWDASFVAYLSK